MIFIKSLILIYLVIFSKSIFSLDYDHLKEKKFKRPKRSVSIIADKYSYYPESLVFFVGEEIDIFVTGTDKKPGCFMLPEKEVFISAKKGELTKASLKFDAPGVFKFYCPKGNMSGQITVLLHPTDKRRRELREIASKKIIKVWRPREE